MSVVISDRDAEHIRGHLRDMRGLWMQQPQTQFRDLWIKQLDRLMARLADKKEASEGIKLVASK